MAANGVDIPEFPSLAARLLGSEIEPQPVRNSKLVFKGVEKMT